MKTKSEEITSLISKKYFLSQYIYNDVYVKEGSQEMEFCDCLIEFNKFYIVIQIKESHGQTEITSKSWFDKKVVRKAKQQLKDTYRFYRDSTNTIFSKTSELVIDRNKTLIPLIVFLNTCILEYKRVVESKSLDSPINIFSYDDFKLMLETIVMPYDILKYLQYRTLFKSDNNGKIIFDEVNGDVTIMGLPSNEQDYSEWFLARTYYHDIIQYELQEENISYYNQIISDINNQRNFIRDNFIEDLVCMSYKDADRIAKNWIKLVELAKKEQFVKPYRVIVEDRIYIFLVRPSTMAEDEFLLRLELFFVYSQYKYQVKLAHVISFQNAPLDQYCIGLCDVDLKTIESHVELVQEAKKLYE